VMGGGDAKLWAMAKVVTMKSENLGAFKIDQRKGRERGLKRSENVN